MTEKETPDPLVIARTFGSVVVIAAIVIFVGFVPGFVAGREYQKSLPMADCRDPYKGQSLVSTSNNPDGTTDCTYTAIYGRATHTERAK